MKSNKGYTLVELMVAVLMLVIIMAEVGALMVNSQKLYTSGFYEVNLQENAQQIITQLQDMTMNADTKVETVASTAGGVASDILILQSHKRTSDPKHLEEVNYRIGRDVDFGMDMTGADYSTLYLSVNDGTPIPIGEGVQSLEVEKLCYEDHDVITFQVNMKNQQYSYSASSELYLRNEPGSPDIVLPPVGSGPAADVDLTVQRIHEYDLKDYVPSDYTCFKWKENATELSTQYDLDGSKLKCSSLNAYDHWDEDVTAIIYAGKDESYSDVLEIKINTEAVNDGIRMPLYVWNNTTADCLSVIPVKGICTCAECSANDMITIDAQITLDIEGKDVEVNGSTYKMDLPIYRGSTKFTIRGHEPDSEHDMGWPYTAWENTVGKWDNEIFARYGGGDTIDISRANFEFQPWEHIEGKPLEWQKDHDTGKEWWKENYTKCGPEYLKWPEEGAWAGDYKLQHIHTDTTNAFGFNTTTDLDDGRTGYWDYIVDYDGYVRLHLWVDYGSGAIFDAYGYVFPQMFGDEDQHKKLWDIIVASDPDDANPGGSDPYASYWDEPHPTY